MLVGIISAIGMNNSPSSWNQYEPSGTPKTVMATPASMPEIAAAME
jgi:hypothetical protein